MCDCVEKIESDIKEKCQKNYKKNISSVICAGKILELKGGKVKTTSMFNIELEGQKKIEEIKVAHSFCPYCGVSVAV